MTKIIQNMQGHTNRGGHNNLSAAAHTSSSSHQGRHQGQSFFQNSPSLAETTMGKYNGVSTHPNSIPTKTHPKTGLQHPYNSRKDYLSEYPVTFRGCFNCGSREHWRLEFCKDAKLPTFNRARFLMNCGHINPRLKDLMR